MCVWFSASLVLGDQNMLFVSCGEIGDWVSILSCGGLEKGAGGGVSLGNWEIFIWRRGLGSSSKCLLAQSVRRTEYSACSVCSTRNLFGFQALDYDPTTAIFVERYLVRWYLLSCARYYVGRRTLGPIVPYPCTHQILP